VSTIQHTGSPDDAGAISPKILAHDQPELSASRPTAARRAHCKISRIRLISLASSRIWQIAAMNVDPVLLTTPTRSAGRRRLMIARGMWAVLWPSLLVW